MIIHIRDNKKLLATIIQGTDAKGFFSRQKDAIQVGILDKEFKDSVEPHMHDTVKIGSLIREEVIFLLEGKIAVDFYSAKGKKITSNILHKGDCLIQYSGGHGFHMLKKSKLFIVKLGEYSNKHTGKILISD